MLTASNVDEYYSELTQSVYNQWIDWYSAGSGSSYVTVLMAAMSNDALVTVDSGGCVRLWETAIFNLTKSLSQWRSMIGEASLQHNLQVEFVSSLNSSSKVAGMSIK